jgi:hypothetical protein
MENHEAEADAPAQSKKVLFVVQSVVAAALFLIVLRCSGGETPADIIWRLSILVCSYFYSAVCVLSAATSKARMFFFFFFTYAAFLAFVVDAVLSRAAGTAIIYLDSVWMAAVFGHALAGGTSASSQKASVISAGLLPKRSISRAAHPARPLTLCPCRRPPQLIAPAWWRRRSESVRAGRSVGPSFHALVYMKRVARIHTFVYFLARVRSSSDTVDSVWAHAMHAPPAVARTVVKARHIVLY